MSVINIGVYCITCTANGRTYFGSSVNLKRRLDDHKRDLNNGSHGNRHLQEDWDFHGSENFEFKVLVRHPLSKYKLLKLEDLFIHNYWDGQHFCYNIACDARSPMRGRKASATTLAKLSKANLGRKHSEEAKEKMSQAAKGNTRCLGHKASKETRIKQAVARMGRKASDETKAKIAEASRGRDRSKVSDATREKLSQSAKNRLPMSMETRIKMSEARKNYWAAKEALEVNSC
jgi:group I intron endonuclease